MIECPRCGGDNIAAESRQSNRRPRARKGVVVRHHRCRDCAYGFRSYQVVPMTRELVEAIQDQVERAA